MSELNVGIVGFDITPEIDPVFGAWGTTPSITEIDMPLLARCVALRQDDRLLLWFGSDLIGENMADTDALRDEVAEPLGLRRDQVIWSVSQTHASGAIPGSSNTGSTVTETTRPKAEALAEGRRRFISKYVEAGRQAIEQLQPARIWAGQGYCDSISYNSRLPMPGGGSKFSRNYAEALQSGKYYDPIIGLVRFDDLQGQPLGAIFNFNCHPATLIMDKYVSPDYVGTARQYVEDTIDGAPAMFLQGFCGDVHPRCMFGTAENARESGRRLGEAAAKAMQHLIPARCEPFDWHLRQADLPLQPPPSPAEIDARIAERQAFIDELETDPQATWVDGYNMPEQMDPADRTKLARAFIDYFQELRDLRDAGGRPLESVPVLLGAVRMGDVAAVLTPGENFAMTALRIRQRSPFVHTLVGQDTNGFSGYIGTDDEIDRGGAETYVAWHHRDDRGLLTPPAKGAAQRVADNCIDLLRQLQG